MTSGECFENKWFYMKYIGKYLSVEILLTRECIHDEKKSLPIINIIGNNVALEGIFRLPQETRGYNG